MIKGINRGYWARMFDFNSYRVAPRWTVRRSNSCVSRIVRWWRVEETKEQTTECIVFEYDSIISARTVRTVLVTMRSKARGRQCFFFFFFSNRSSFPGRFALLSKYDLVAYRGSMKFYSFLFRSNTFQMYRKIFNCVIDE